MEVKAETVSYTGSSLPDASGSGTSAADFQQSMFPGDQFFHFDDNVNNYPKYMEFSGFPNGYVVYYDDDDAIGDDACIRGLALTYKDMSGTTQEVWLTGNEADSANYENFTTPFDNVRIQSVTGSIDSQNGVQCLASLGFE